jgi:protease I
VQVAAPKTGPIYGMKHHDKAGDVKVDLALSSATTEDFDAVMLPGGAPNADALRFEKEAQRFVQEMDRTGKPIAFICHAPWLLVSAGLTRGRTLTSYHTIQDDIKNAGGNWVDRDVVRDRDWVSAESRTTFPRSTRKCFRSLESGGLERRRDRQSNSTLRTKFAEVKRIQRRHEHGRQQEMCPPFLYMSGAVGQVLQRAVRSGGENFRYRLRL